MVTFALFIGLLFVVNGYKTTETKCYGSGTSSDLTLVWTDDRKEYTLTPSTAGLTLTPPETANEPKVTFNSVKDKYYHFLMVDPDISNPFGLSVMYSVTILFLVLNAYNRVFVGI